MLEAEVEILLKVGESVRDYLAAALVVRLLMKSLEKRMT